MPEYIHFILHGYSQWETERMLALIWIESFKYHFDDLVEQYNPSEAEIAQYKAHIDELIKAYNPDKKKDYVFKMIDSGPIEVFSQRG